MFFDKIGKGKNHLIIAHAIRFAIWGLYLVP